ncbi:MAG TPA: hypothetical protein DER33_01485 [Syntrophomonas sp.]|nr:hypothetical protein [Syntrophomonas sp.]HCF70261.1 hypothetical protein [Syntrophomonas sp.]
MKKAMPYLLLLMLILIAGCGAGGSGEKSSPDPNKIPSFACQDLDGNDVTSDIFSGSQLTLVNVWTTG